MSHHPCLWGEPWPLTVVVHTCIVTFSTQQQWGLFPSSCSTLKSGKAETKTTKGNTNTQPPMRQLGCSTAAHQAQTPRHSALCLNHRAIKLIGISVWFFPQEHLFPCVVNNSVLYFSLPLLCWHSVNLLNCCSLPFPLGFLSALGLR